MDILVFKTNVSHQEEIKEVKALLKTVPTIENWNFDLEDSDRILRIVGVNISPRSVEELLQRAGINCFELED